MKARRLGVWYDQMGRKEIQCKRTVSSRADIAAYVKQNLNQGIHCFYLIYLDIGMP